MYVIITKFLRIALSGTLLFLGFLAVATAEKPVSSISLRPPLAQNSKAEEDRKAIFGKMTPPPTETSKKSHAICTDSRGMSFRDGQTGYVNCLEELKREQHSVRPTQPVGIGRTGVGVQFEIVK